jgi:hypothetical protein
MPRILGLLTLLLLLPSCVKNYGDPALTGDGGVGPIPTPVPVAHVIEFRVLGTARTVHISYGNAQDGTTDVDTITPWVAQVRTSKASLFVFITATPLDFGLLRVQVFIDGSLFREASVDDSFLLDPVSISGTVDLTTLQWIRR